MITKKINSQDLKENLNYIIDHLKQEGLIVYPTDTIYGIGGDYKSEKVISLISKIKERDNVLFSVACSSLEMISNIADIRGKEQFINNHLPGAFTIILKKKQKYNSNETIAVRIPDNQYCIKIIDNFQKPIITTSVNKQSFPPLNKEKDIINFLTNIPLEEKIIFISDKDQKKNIPSTIIDLSEDKIKIIRHGAGIIKNKDICIK